MERDYFKEMICQKPSPEQLDRDKAAFDALLEYETNCLKIEANYKNPQWAKIPIGQRMEDFAAKHGVSVKEMKRFWRQVEHELETKK